MTLTQILQKIREAFYTKKEIDSMGGGTSLSDTISQKANASDLTAHTSNTNIHVTASDKTKWNAKQDALTSQQISNIDNVANKADDSNVVHKTGDYLTGTLKYNTNSTNDTYLGGIEYLKDNTRFGYLLGHVYNNGQFKDLLIYGKDHVYINSNYVTLSSGGNTLIYDNGILHNPNGALGTSANKWADVNTVLLNGKTPAYADNLASYLPLSGGQMHGSIFKSSDGASLDLCGGTQGGHGAYIALRGKDYSAQPGAFEIYAHKGSSYTLLLGTADGSLYWSGSNFTCTNGALGNSSSKWKTINGFDVTGIGHIGNSSMDQSGNVKTYTRTNPNVGTYAHYCVAPDNGWVACREHGGSGTFQVCALGSSLVGLVGLDSDPIIISPVLNQYQFGSIPVRKGEYYAIISGNASASHTMRFIYNNG